MQICFLINSLPRRGFMILLIHVYCLQVFLTNLSATNVTTLNDLPVKFTEALLHQNEIGIIDRKFRFEYPPQSPLRAGTHHCTMYVRLQYRCWRCIVANLHACNNFILFPLLAKYTYIQLLCRRIPWRFTGTDT